MAVPPTSAPPRPSQAPTPATAPRPSPSAGLAFARLLGRTAPPKGKLPPLPATALPKKKETAELGNARPLVLGSDPLPTHARVEPRRDEPETDHHHRPSADDLLDPSVRQAALLAPPPQVQAAVAPAAEAVEAPRARMSLEELMPLLVRRIAWAGDRTKGTVRLEIGAGAYAGATLLVHADQGRVRVEVSGVASDDLRARIDQRLRRHGLDVESVT